MHLSVVVPTLNGREELARCLDALAEHVPDAEVVVVNGPSADGTTGMVRERDDVAVLVEIAARSINVARNAGIERATGDAIALLDRNFSVEPGWLEAVGESLADADVVTGPTHETLAAGMTSESVEHTTVSGRDVTFLNAGNVAFDATVLQALDGFDEYLEEGGASDLAHRLAGNGYAVEWSPSMSVRCEFEADGGIRETDWSWKYRSLAYSLAKNYGLRPTVVRRLLSQSVRDAVGSLREVLRGEAGMSRWLGTGRDVVGATGRGFLDGLKANGADRSSRRNPNGLSTRADRAVDIYDFRGE